MSADFKPKFVPWYEDDFQADRAVKRWTSVQRALYRNLLMESYYNDLRPNLPNDDSQLWLLADAESLQQWLDNKEPILVKFYEDVDSDGVSILWNKRVRQEWGEMQERLEQRRNAGAASAKARLLKSSGNKKSARAQDTKTQDIKVKDTTQQHTTTHKSVEHTFNDRSTDVQPVVAVDVVEPSPVLAGKAENLLRNSKIIAEFRKAATNSGVHFDATDDHIESAVAFHDSVGALLAMTAWTCWVNDSEHLIDQIVNGKKTKVDRAWPLQEFIEKGHSVEWVEKVTPYVNAGICDPDTIRFFEKHFDFESVAEASLTRDDIALLKSQSNLLEFRYKRSNADDVRGFVDSFQAKSEVNKRSAPVQQVNN